MTRMRSASLIALGFTVVLTAVASADTAPLPRYRLEVGQEITWAGTSDFKHTRGARHTDTQWTAWVVKANADGSWHLILRWSKTITLIYDQEHRGPEMVKFARCDVHPDGRVTADPSLGNDVQPWMALPRLPRDEAESKRGWTARHPHFDETTRYSTLPAEAGQFVIKAVHESPLDAMYGLENKDVVTFDSARGLPVKIESEGRQTFGFDGKSTGTLKLVGVKTLDAAELKNFAAEADRFLAARDAYRQAVGRGEGTVEEVKARLDKGEKALKDAAADLKLDAFRRQIDADLEGHQDLCKSEIQDAERREAVVGKPAVEFEADDLNGKKHALKDYRGKVVILDFWYRGCGWCVRAMPQMKQVAEHFKGKLVVVFGMNIDEKEDDAKFVVEKMGLNYGVSK